MSKCDFQLRNPSDWRVNVGPLAAVGSMARLRALNANLAERSLKVRSDKCDFSVQLSAAQQTPPAQLAVTAVLQADKCDFAVALGGALKKRRVLSRIGTRVASDKCDFAVSLKFGDPAAPLFRVVAVASDKCDFRIRQIEIRQPSGKWKAVDLGTPKESKK